MSNKMKKSLLIGVVAGMFALSFTLSASPPARDVGKVILVDDHSSTSLTDVVRSYNLNAISPDLTYYTPEFSTPAFIVVSTIDLPSTVTVLTAAGEPVPPERCSGSDGCKSDQLVKENLHLVNCCIRQCFSRAVAAA